MSNWIVHNKGADFFELGRRLNISPITVRIIRNRGYQTEEEMRTFLEADFASLFDPSLLPGISEAAKVLINAILNQNTIRIVGDYDADGICATSILMICLKKLGANVDYYIPHRIEDGYGISMSIIEQAHADGKQLLITCDNGIAAHAECKRALELGMQIIVTDHHEIRTDADSGEQILPEATACVNPHILTNGALTYPQDGICGAVVAMKVMQYVFLQMLSSGSGVLQGAKLSPDFNGFLDFCPGVLELAALATNCDVMKLEGENRIIVKRGLERMQHSRLPGLKSLITVTGIKKINSHALGYVLGPCLNAGGRLDTAVKSAELLLCEDDDQALFLASELKALNDERKAITEKGRKDGFAYIKANHMEDDKIFVVCLPDLHESVAGLVAGKITESYYRPSIVFTKTKENKYKASARSVKEYDMYQGLASCDDLLEKWGGHKMAAGLTVAGEAQIHKLRKRLNDNCTLSAEKLIKNVHLEMELPPEQISVQLIKEWDQLEPAGYGNPKPIFVTRDLTFVSGKKLGAEGQFAKYRVQDAKGAQYDVLQFKDLEKWHAFLDEAFGQKNREALYCGKPEVPMTVKIVYYAEINEYNGRESVQLKMEDYKI